MDIGLGGAVLDTVSKGESEDMCFDTIVLKTYKSESKHLFFIQLYLRICCSVQSYHTTYVDVF